MEELDDQRLSVQRAFQDYKYVVPSFQREFVWEDEQVQELVDDVQGQFLASKESQYFLGTMIVHKEDDGRLAVIDGQQRLTSLFLWLCAFRQHLPSQAAGIDGLLFNTAFNLKGMSTKSCSLELQYDTSASTIESIYADEGLEDALAFGSRKRLIDAYRVMEESIKQFGLNHGSNEVPLLMGFLLNNVVFIQIETSTLGDALKIFETTNDRGVRLNPMDLLKNLIFSKLQDDQFDKVSEQWKRLVDLLDKNKMKGLRFLRYFLMARYDTTKEDRGIIREERIYDWIRDNDKVCGVSRHPLEFMETIFEAAQAYVRFSHGKDADDEFDPYLDNIRKGARSFSFHLLLMLAARGLKPEQFRWFVRQTEVLVFYFVFLKSPTRELEPKLAGWAKELRSIAAQPSGQHERLCDFVNAHYLPEVDARKDEFNRKLEHLTWYDLQQYQLRYLLAKITQYAELARSGDKAPDALDNYLKKSQIEHILPEAPTLEQRSRFEVSSPGTSYDDAVAKMGNLTLLEKSFNASAGNKDFVDKAEVYRKSHFYLTKSISEFDKVGKNTSLQRLNERLICFSDWSAKSIEERQAMMARLALSVWHLDI
jgi:uncharacterized protein with ParB-like and HNH nuclease domain